MELGTDLLVSPAVEVPVLDGDVVTSIRTLAGRGGRQADDCAGSRRVDQYGAAVSAPAG